MDLPGLFSLRERRSRNIGCFSNATACGAGFIIGPSVVSRSEIIFLSLNTMRIVTRIVIGKMGGKVF